MRSNRRIRAIAILAHQRWATKNERTHARIQLLTRADDLGFAVEHLHEIDGNPITDTAAWDQVKRFVTDSWPETGSSPKPVVLLAGHPRPPAPPQFIVGCDLYDLELAHSNHRVADHTPDPRPVDPEPLD